MTFVTQARLLAALVLCAAPAAHAFTLLNFPSSEEIGSLGRYSRWFYGSKWFNSGSLDSQAIDQTFFLSYRVDDSFFLSEGNLQPGEAATAVENALQSWSAATGGRFQFSEAPWAAVPNAGPATSANNFYQWEGPSFDEWNEDYQSPDPQYGLTTLPGWGANLEFFSRPVGFSITSNGVTYQMTSGILGFAVVNRTTPNNTRIASVDIYLNEKWTWTTDGSGTGAGNNFDIETVVLHELGHAFGLDHPNETMDGGCGGACNDSPNFDPFTLQEDAGAYPNAVMLSDFSSVKRSLTPDEIGGMAFLYPPIAGDLNSDFAVTNADLSAAMAASVGLQSLNPLKLRATDFIDVDGLVSVLETTQIVRWVVGAPVREAPQTSPSPSINFSRTKLVRETTTTTIQTWCRPTPADLGLGGTVAVEISADIPAAAESQSYSFDFYYDPAALSNPRVIEWNASIQGSFLWREIEPGHIRVRRNGVTDSTWGYSPLATVLLDVNIQGALASQSQLFWISDYAYVPMDAGEPRRWGDLPDEAVTLTAVPMFVNDYDVDGDGTIDLDDLIAWYASPTDVDRDGDTDAEDLRVLEIAVRDAD